MTPMRRAVVVILALTIPGVVGAIQMESGLPTEPGFQADRVYQVSNPDSIDLSTGNLTLTIPIGGTYPVGGDFSYSLVLSYSSLIWDFDQRVESPPECDPPYDRCDSWRQAFPNRRSNAGIGWRLSLGELYSPLDPNNPWDDDWVYVSPDGSEHVFYDRLHDRDALTSSGGYSYWYTRDGSYLRMRFQNSPPAIDTRRIEYPDGTIHTFEEDASYPNRYRLTKIADRHYNELNISYNGSPATLWTLTDRHGREHHVHFTARTSDGQTVYYVSSVELEAFGGATATYGFTYAATSIDRSWKDSDPETSLTTSVPLLTGISLPDGTAYSMPVASSYHIDGTEELRDLPGMIKRMVLPTLGSVNWTWQKWSTPGAWYVYPCGAFVPDDRGCPTDFYEDWVGVLQKIYRDRAGLDIGIWEYMAWTGEPIAEGTDLYTERRTVVTSPEGDDTVYYFRALPGDGGPNGEYQDQIVEWDYALPYTRRTSVTDTVTGRPLYLSVEHYDGPIGSIDPVTGDKKRSVYVRYENSRFDDQEPGAEDYDITYRLLTRHQAASRTTYDDDGGKYRQTTSFDFDGLGHYRTTVTDGNLGGAVRHKTFTNYNPARGTYKPLTPTVGDPTSSDWFPEFGGPESPADSFTMWPATNEWVLGTSTYAEEFEKDASAVITYGRSDTCFDAGTGKLLRSRRLKDTTYPGTFHANDVLTVNLYENWYGDVTSRRSYGADLQSIATTALCGMAIPGSTQARTDFTYQYGSMKTATPMTAAGVAMTFKLVDRDIDLSTGLPFRSRDSSGLPTDYAFDSSGRLTWIMPTLQAPGGGTVTRGAWAQHCYSNAAGSALAKVEVMMRPNGLTPSCTDTSNVLARSSYTYDDLGRLAGEYTLLPGSVWNQRLHGYNGMGWKVWETEWQPNGAGTLKKTTYSNFDPFGRPLTITPPDGSAHNVTIAYTGERRVQRTAKVGTSRTGSVVNETSVTTTDLYDGVGRLWQRTEKSSPSGTDVITIYTYDALGRLREASTQSGVQVRDWSFDGRGFLLSETVPEKGGTGGYGTVSYSSYDVRGQAGRVIDGPNDLSSLFDDAGRLTSVTETGTGKVVRLLTYGTANTTGNLANGKLTVAEAGNFYDGTTNFQFRETYTYGGTDGRVSQRVTLGGIVGENQGTFTLGYTWTPLGDVATVTYPQKTGLPPARIVTNTYSNGFLTTVTQGATNYASSISYHTNATVNRVTYGNSVWVDHAKDPNDMARPAGISLGNATSSWSTGTYGYDGAGNIITMTGTSTDTFVYDKVSRIKEARQTVGGVLKTQSYAYDSFGNLTTIGTQTLVVDPATNRISCQECYDAAGSMTSWGDYSYAYYPTNQMKQMIGDGRTTLFGYSADGERVGTWDSVTLGITYVLRGLDNKPLRQYREFNGGWTWQKDWVYRDGLLLATVEPSGTKYFHLDHLGTTRRITNSSRAVIASHDYYPFGEEITASSQDSEALKFTGHERDLRDPTKTTDDLDYMHARYYNPWIARFLSTDPVGGTPGAPQSWNRYSYVKNNPLRLIDPDGKYGRGTGFTDQEWKRFQKTQQSAANRMEKRAEKLNKKAAKREEKGKDGAEGLRISAGFLREGAQVLRSDGSDGYTANAVGNATYMSMGGSEHGAAATQVCGKTVWVNNDHDVWSSSGFGSQRAIGHESLHAIGLHDEQGSNGAIAYKKGEPPSIAAFQELQGTPIALINPDHIMDLVY